MDHKLHRVCLRSGGSYIKSPKWLLHKGATINPKNENDDECDDESLGRSTISALNYNEIITKLRKKSLKAYLKEFNMKINIFHHTKEIGKILNETMSQLLLMSYLHHKIVKK